MVMQVVAPGCVPDPAEQPDATRRAAMERALNYMGLEAGTRMEDVKIDKVTKAGNASVGRR